MTDATQKKTGCLYLVATPIGNLEDISLRALRILREAGKIACEDTRHTRKLLAHYDIHATQVSYHQHNEVALAPKLAAEIAAGATVALVTDAGTPSISDPGHRLVAACLELGLAVVPVPGPSAVIAALTGSGLPADAFTFVGFLPSRGGERRKAIRELANEPRSVVFYEAPHRLIESLTDAREILGDRRAAVARELTKVYEEFVRGTLDEVVARFQETPPRGEITVVIAPGDPGAVGAADDDLERLKIPLARRVAQIEREKGVDHKSALKIAAHERGINRREAYRQVLASRDERD
jgi:16S rRNA (cytidine1402-2'-O)-methyltransferase